MDCQKKPALWLSYKYLGPRTLRTIEYLSPTALFDWRANREEFYRKRLADNKLPRMPQTDAMAVGSAFDAYVKAELGKGDFEQLFCAQVEEQNRAQALVDGERCLSEYKKCGAFSDLQIIINDAQFELTVQESVAHQDLGPVPLLGKPDAFFKNANGDHVILDWKVNGYYSKRGAYINKGYVVERPSGRRHKEAHVINVHGVDVNISGNMETFNREWATQTAMYSWLLGAEVGSEILVCIDQLVWRDNQMTVGEHRAYVGREFQLSLFSELAELWSIISSGWIFRDMPEEESRARQRSLDQTCNDPALLACL